MDVQQLKEIASQLACPSGEGAVSIVENMNNTNAFMTERSIEMLAPKSGERIVEIGPGNGILSIPIVESLGKGGHYIGIEWSTDMARETLDLLGQKKIARVTVYTEDCMSAPIEDGTIDGLMAINVLYFIKDLRAFSAKISGWLKPGARLVIGVRSAQFLKSLPFTRFEFQIRSLEEITEGLQANGFGDVNSVCFDEGTITVDDQVLPIDSQIIKATAN